MEACDHELVQEGVLETNYDLADQVFEDSELFKIPLIEVEPKISHRLEERDLGLEKAQQEGRCASIGPLILECVLAAHRNKDEEKDNYRFPSQQAFDGSVRISSKDRERVPSGLLSSRGASCGRFNNGQSGALRQLTGAEKGLNVSKGRCSVTSTDIELIEDQTPITATHRSPSTQAPQLSQSPIWSSTIAVPSATVFTFLQSLLLDIVSQKVDISSDRHHELLQMVADLENSCRRLVEEVHTVKLQTISLERRLIAIYNKEKRSRYGGAIEDR